MYKIEICFSFNYFLIHFICDILKKKSLFIMPKRKRDDDKILKSSNNYKEIKLDLSKYKIPLKLLDVSKYDIINDILSYIE